MASGPSEEPKFRHGVPAIDSLAKRKGQHIEFYSVTHGYAVAFPAFLTKLSQKYSTATQEVSPGQTSAGPIYVKTGAVQRNIDVGFQVVAGSSQGAKNNLAKLGAMIRLLYPTMTKEGIYYVNPKPSIWDINFSNLISFGSGANPREGGRQKGITAIIKDFNTDFDLDSGFVEGAGHDLFPKLVNVAMELIIMPVDAHGWYNDPAYEGGTNTQEIPGFESFPFGTPDQRTRNRVTYRPGGVETANNTFNGVDTNQEAPTAQSPQQPPASQADDVNRELERQRLNSEFADSDPYGSNQ